MSTAAILALVITLTNADGYIEQPVALMPAAECLAAMQSIWDIPADSVDVDGLQLPALDASCVDPALLPQG
jgi:hypothetical protein